jgi:Arc/MetJ family transcription regulator
MCMREPIRETRTNIVLDDALIAEAAKLTGIQTRRALVHEALRVLIEQRRRRPLADLRGKIKFAPGYDHKAARAGEP